MSTDRDQHDAIPGERAARMAEPTAPGDRSGHDGPAPASAPPAEPPHGDPRPADFVDRDHTGSVDGPAPEAYDEPAPQARHAVDDRGAGPGWGAAAAAGPADRSWGDEPGSTGRTGGAGRAADAGTPAAAPGPTATPDPGPVNGAADDPGRPRPAAPVRAVDDQPTTRPEPARPADGGSATTRREPADRRGGTDAGGSTDERLDLVPAQRSQEYRQRWESLKARFVDEPRSAVRDADELVGLVLDEVEATFRTRRGELERDLLDDAASTEDLRLALGRYRSFFDKLLAY